MANETETGWYLCTFFLAIAKCMKNSWEFKQEWSAG